MAISVAYLQAGSYSAEMDRYSHVAMFDHATAVTARNGVLNTPGNPLRVAVGGGLNLNIAAGQAIVEGVFVFTNTTAVIVPVAAGGASDRTDLVIIRVYDQEQGDATSEGKIEIVQGTSATPPAAPARSLVLAQLTVPAGAATIVSGNITDYRTYTTGLGGIVTLSNVIATPSLGSGYPVGTIFWDNTAMLVAVKSGTNTVTPIDPKAQKYGGIQVSRSADENYPNGSWRALDMDITDNSDGEGLTRVSRGVQVTYSGRYQVSGGFRSTLFNNTGRRIIDIGTTSDGRMRSDYMALTTNRADILQTGGEISASAGQTISLWVYQDSGQTLLIGDRWLSVRRVA